MFNKTIYIFTWFSFIFDIVECTKKSFNEKTVNQPRVSDGRQKINWTVLACSVVICLRGLSFNDESNNGKAGNKTKQRFGILFYFFFQRIYPALPRFQIYWTGLRAYLFTIWGACGVMVIVVGHGYGNTSSNPGRDW